MDINPLLVTEKEVIALDARIVVSPELFFKTIKPYSHLILQPYPEHYSKNIIMRDGNKVLLVLLNRKMNLCG